MVKGKTALVTGSTSGIGLGIATRLAADGANIVLNGFGDAAQIEALRKDLAAKNGVQVVYDGADMTKPDAIAAMMKKVIEKFGAIDILVNNAGVQHVAPVDEFPVDKWDLIIALNLTSASVIPSAFACSGICLSTSGVRTKPGQMTLARMPSLAPSLATVRASPSRPCLAVT